MSQENVEIVRHIYESGLIDRELLKLATPDKPKPRPPDASPKTPREQAGPHRHRRAEPCAVVSQPA
jgi:hypothetical protein